MERLALYPARVVEGAPAEGETEPSLIVEIQQGGEWKPSSDSITLSQADADSTGFVIIGENLSLYIVNTQPDLQYTINKLIETTEQLIATCEQLTAVCNISTWVIAATGNVFGVNPEAVAIGAQVEAISAEVDTIKTDLTEFKLK